MLASLMAHVSPTELAGLITAGGTLGATLTGVYGVLRQRHQAREDAENADETVTITQAQGANLIMDATVRTLDRLLEKERLRAQRAEARADRAEASLKKCRERRAS